MDPADPATPPPPRLEEFRPGTIVAVFDDGATALHAARAVSSRSANEPYVMTSDEVLLEDAERQREAGLATRAYRFLSSFLSDQGALQARYVEAAREGGHIVVAVAHEDDQAQAIWDDLRALGAHDGTYFAGSTIRELV